jgi:hypothetical protein
MPADPIPLPRDQIFGRINSSGHILPSQKRPKRDLLRGAFLGLLRSL